MRLTLATAGVLLALTAPAASAAPCDIACENSKPGTPPGIWDIQGSGDPSIQGYATDISVNQGQTVQFKINSATNLYRADIYRTGWYGGDGARKVDTVRPLGAAPGQPGCGGDSSTGLVDCGNWSVSASWNVPADAVSGIYFAHLVREDGTSGESHIPFVVRDDDGGSDLLFQTSDTTWQAYNQYGGNSLYTGGPGTNPGRAYKVSYNRPFTTRDYAPEDWVFNAEYPMVRWLERNGYDVSYFTGVDTDRYGGELREHRAFMSVGHDEYWSAQQRSNVEAARDAGVSLAFLSGNEMFWKTRWEGNHRTLVSYKETHANAKIDPSGVWTGTWRDPRFSPPADGGRPENAVTGTAFTVNSGTVALEVPAAEGQLRLWRNTGLGGGPATLTADTVGYEWDEDLDNGARPPGLMRLSSTTASGIQKLLDYGSTYGAGTATHSLTLYRDSNGTGRDALVFGAGTVQWSWGLDGVHDRGSSAPSGAMQQAMVNLLADMAAQPATLQAGLTRASASTDCSPPRSSPSSSTVGVSAGTPATVTGTASDSGGRVGGVEVSADGGASWHRADGRENWSYSWTPASSGQVTVRSRAADDSGQLEGVGACDPPGTGGASVGGAGRGRGAEGPKVKSARARCG
jgi:hypothetical protein